MLRLALTAAAALALVAPAQAATWSPATPPYSCPAGFGYTHAGRGIAISGVQSAADGGGVPAQIDAVWGELVPETVYRKTGKLPFEPLGLGLFRSDGFG